MTELDLYRKLRFEIARAFLGKDGGIICLHRVGGAGSVYHFSGNRFLSISADNLDRLLTFVKRDLGFEIVSLKDHVEALRNSKRRRYASITFDDGYRDNLEFGLPVLEKHGAPATIFVATGMPDHEIPMWWIALEKYAAERKINLQSLFEEVRAISLSEGDVGIRNFFKTLRWPDGLWKELSQTHSLSWNEISSLSQHPLISIGSHSLSHSNLRRLSSGEVVYEMRKSKSRLEDVCGTKVAYFAYPFGSASECSEREFSLAEEAGFEAAFTTQSGLIKRSSSLFSIPRFCVSDPQLNWNLLANKFSGIDENFKLIKKFFIRNYSGN